jgi:hypothetical protein
VTTRKGRSVSANRGPADAPIQQWGKTSSRAHRRIFACLGSAAYRSAGRRRRRRIVFVSVPRYRRMRMLDPALLAASAFSRARRFAEASGGGQDRLRCGCGDHCLCSSGCPEKPRITGTIVAATTTAVPKSVRVSPPPARCPPDGALIARSTAPAPAAVLQPRRRGAPQIANRLVLPGNACFGFGKQPLQSGDIVRMRGVALHCMRHAPRRLRR